MASHYTLAGLRRYELRGRSLNMVIAPTKSRYVDAIKDNMPKKGSLHSKWDIQGLRKLIGRGSLTSKKSVVLIDALWVYLQSFHTTSRSRTCLGRGYQVTLIHVIPSRIPHERIMGK